MTTDDELTPPPHDEIPPNMGDDIPVVDETAVDDVPMETVPMESESMDTPQTKTTDTDLPTVSVPVQQLQQSDSYQHLPHNLEVESALLGALLRNPNSFESVDGVVAPDHFYATENQRLFGYIKSIADRGQTATPTTLKHVIAGDELLQSVGGFDYLNNLVAGVVSTVNVGEYAKTLYELHVRRSLIGIGESMVTDGYDSTNLDQTADEQIGKAETRLTNLAITGDADRSSVSLGDAMTESLNSIELAYKRDGGLAGVETGFKALNEILGGFHRSDLLILAGRPAMGKTALAINCALAAAKAYSKTTDAQGNEVTNGGRVVFFSLEMSAEQLAGRIISQESGVSGDKMRRGAINQDEFEQVANATRQLADTPLMLDDTPGLSITGLRQRARRLQRQGGLDMIIVDYLQLLSGDASKKYDGSRVQEVSDITRGLKMVAKELKVPVIALSQLSRTVESRDPPRPQLADLRESGSIEQDADVVMFIYRPEYYMQKSQPERKVNENEEKFMERMENFNTRLAECQNVAEVIIAKQRHGPVGDVGLYFNGDTTQFGDLDPNH